MDNPRSLLDVAELPPIPGYELLRPIGAGSMGSVYLARQLDPPRTVAIKFLHRLNSDHSGILSKRYEREARLMDSLDHPHVVRMYDCGKRLGSFYLVMEHVAGIPLRSLIRPGEPWPASRALGLLNAVAEALAYIHEKGILHLDLKPENILRDDVGGTFKISDFGLSLLEIDARLMADAGSAQGTIDYCSPEQRFGLPVDVRSDLFSLATITYELLTGRLPGRVYYPCLPPEIPPGVDEVLRRALARDPDERHGSVTTFHADLQSALMQSVPATLVASRAL